MNGMDNQELLDAIKEQLELKGIECSDELPEYGTSIEYKLKLAYVDQSIELYYKRHCGYHKGNLKIMPYNYKG